MYSYLYILTFWGGHDDRADKSDTTTSRNITASSANSSTLQQKTVMHKISRKAEKVLNYFGKTPSEHDLVNFSTIPQQI